MMKNQIAIDVVIVIVMRLFALIDADQIMDGLDMRESNMRRNEN